ncbi:MAG: hypothetical protein ACM3TN_09290 [Alphaproteobacteria bacterium]
METHVSSEKGLWLFSRRADFWLACGGASVALLAAVLLILWHGDREIDAMDFVLSEFHLGATYDAIIRRRLWRSRQSDVVLIPLVILALTYALSMNGQTIWLTSIALYAAIWHRGRQNFGVARFYQRGMGGPVSQTHDFLFRGAIYLPMAAATLAYTHRVTTDFEGKPYLALNLGAEMTWLIGFVAVICVTAYLALTLRQTLGLHVIASSQNAGRLIHPGEWWIVLAHAVAFGSAYVLGARNASFLLVLAVYHEIQYLYFTYAMARRTAINCATSRKATDQATNDLDPQGSFSAGRLLPTEIKFAASFLVWPVIGFTGAIFGSWAQLPWLAPLGIGGLFCHYWFDGRIWTRRSFKN